MKKIALSMILGLGMLTSAASAGGGLKHGQPCKKTAACESGLVCRLPEEAVTSGGQTFCLPELPPEAPPEEPPSSGGFFPRPEAIDPDNTYTCPGPDHWTGGKLSEY